MTNNSYFVLIAVVLIIAIKNIFKKSNKPRNETFDEKSSHPKAIEEEINEPYKVQPKTKNKWLHPTDEFGKMEEGVISDSITYKRDHAKGKVDKYEFLIKDVNGTRKK